MYKDQFVLCWSIIVSLDNFEAVGNYHWFIENCLLPALTFKEQPQKKGELQTPHTCTADQRLVGPSWLKLSPSRDTTDRSQQNVFGHFLNKVGDATRIRFFFWMRINPIQLWPWLLVITGYFYGIIHSINGVIKVISTYNWYFKP